MKIPSIKTMTTNIKDATAYMPHLLCVSVKHRRGSVWNLLCRSCVCIHALIHGLTHKSSYVCTLCVRECLEYTYSLGTEFFCHEEQDLTATPAEKQIERIERRETLTLHDQKHFSQSCTMAPHVLYLHTRLLSKKVKRYIYP